MTAMLKALRVLFVLFMICAGFFFVIIFNVTVPRDARGKKTVFTVRQGQTVMEIASALEKQKIIRNSFAFELLVRASHDESRIKAGDYRLSPRMSILQIMEKLVKGDVIKDLFTIPEGSRVRDVAAALERMHSGSSVDFLDVATMNRSIHVGGLCPENLEGFLFPDTYEVPHGAGAKEVAEMMTRRFEEVVMPVYEGTTKENRPGLLEIVTIASLVENEARLESERPLIASVYYNRLRKDMPLQCDATIQYVLGGTKPYLDYSDLKIESPYNTYLHRGLTPGPICNPGLSSIKAALMPAEEKYLYYVLNDKKGDGSHVFSVSYEEHERAIKNYQK